MAPTISAHSFLFPVFCQYDELAMRRGNADQFNLEGTWSLVLSCQKVKLVLHISERVVGQSRRQDSGKGRIKTSTDRRHFQSRLGELRERGQLLERHLRVEPQAPSRNYF